MNNDAYRLGSDFSLYKADLAEPKYFLFNIQSGTIFHLNQVSFDMLSLFDGKKNVRTIYNEMESLYNVSRSSLEEDFNPLIETWKAKCVLILEDGHE